MLLPPGSRLGGYALQIHVVLTWFEELKARAQPK